MITKSDKILLYISCLCLALSLFFAIFLSSVAVHFTVISFIIGSALISLFCSQELKSRLSHKIYKSHNTQTSYFMFLIFGSVLLWGSFQGDFFFIKHHNLHWLNVQNAYQIPVYYTASKAFFIFLEEAGIKIKESLVYFLILITSSYLIDWSYSFFKSFELGNYRWDGSSGNPNIWAIQSSLILFLVLNYFYRNGLNKSRLSFYLFAVAILSSIGILKAFSLASFLGLAAAIAALIIFKLFKKPGQILVSSLIILISLAMIYFIYEADMSYFETTKFFLAKKFIPRIKLWSHFDELIANFTSLDYIFGIGQIKYRAWLDSLNRSDFYHAHNMFYHFFFQFGLLGFFTCSVFYYRMLFNSCFVLGVYLLVASIFDVSLFFDENQILLFILIPALELIESRSNSIKNISS